MNHRSAGSPLFSRTPSAWTFSLLIVASGCGNRIAGTWDLTDASWTALSHTEGNTTRTFSAVLELEEVGGEVSGTAVLEATTSVSGGEPDTTTEQGEVTGEREEKGEYVFWSPDLFDFECWVDGDTMVCDDPDTDDWEFTRR